MTDSNEELVMMSGRIPKDLKKLVDMDDRDNQDVLAQALWREVGDERKAELQRRAEEKRREIAELESQRNQREREISNKREELDRVETMLDEYKPRGISEIDAVIDDMVDANATMATDAPRIDRIAREYFNGDVETCIAAISDRKDERDIEQVVIR